MQTIKLKADRNMLCNCVSLPCIHHTLEDHAIMLPKTKTTKQLVLTYFNFALFIQHLCHSLKRSDSDKVKKILKRVINYRLISQKKVIFRVKINQVDPSNGKTALHYACWHNFHAIIKCLLSAPGIDVDQIDNDGLPAHAYYGYQDDAPICNESKLRIIIAHQSKKLFNYLFKDITPQTWSSSVFDKITPALLVNVNDEQRRKIIYSIRDEKGNTILHHAAKNSKQILIELILKYYNDTQNVRNLKGKLPIQYSKTNEIFNYFDNTGEFHKPKFFNVHLFERVKNPVGYILMYFPDIIAHFEDTSPYICSNLINFRIYLDYLKPEIIRKISTFARDPAKNTLFHVIALWNINIERKCEYYKMLDPSIINIRNNYGYTVLHYSQTFEELLELLKLGVHPDFANCRHFIPIKKANGNEIMVCSLQCLAARQVKSGDAPQHLKHFVKCHNPDEKDFNHITIEIIPV